MAAPQQPTGTRTTSGATPLFAASILAIDTETTGLDPASARIVELAAVRLTAGRLDPEPPLIARVRPDIAIPPKSTSIHGITDEMVAGAPPFSGVLPRLTALMGGRLIIGHAVGFDLAILASEARRAALDWQVPRWLCVRTLAMIAAPTLANHSLDGLASWLGVEIVNRHSALGDAEAAARIFLALIPLLEQRGIVTVAQAERASRERPTGQDAAAAAGWEQAPERRPASSAIGGLSEADIHAYRHRVADSMPRNVHIIAADRPLQHAMEMMVDAGVSSVLVADDPSPGQPVAAYGILTERDVLRRVRQSGPAILAQPSGPLATRPLSSIRANAFVYRAIGRLSRLGVRHLGVHSDLGRLIGVVSARDLLRTRGGAAVALDDAIEGADSSRALAAAWSTLPAVAGALTAEGVDARIVCRIVSEEIRAMTRRAGVLAERAMQEAGRGGPPADFCLLVLGSGGRGESLLAPDQDNALVFEAEGAEADEGSATDRWFADYAERLSVILDEAGIPLCRGGVMARNPQWRGSLATWRARIEAWVGKSRPEDLLNVDIFFDMAPVHGDIELGQRLFDLAYEIARDRTAFAKLLGEAIPASDALTVWGGLRTEDGRIDLKRYGLFPIVALARTLAIRHGVALRATDERLAGLGEKLGAHADFDLLERSHRTLVAALLRQQAQDIEQGHAPSNRLDPTMLSKTELDDVKRALRDVRSVPTLVRDLMFG